MIKRKPRYNPKNPPKYVKKWIERLKKVLDKAPEGIWFYSTGELNIMVTDENYEIMDEKSGSPDQDYILETITSHIFEGGGF